MKGENIIIISLYYTLFFYPERNHKKKAEYSHLIKDNLI